MATKNHVDNSVAERRLRPIYDWLDCGNNKRALQEADKLLKKQPAFQCAKVLKGLALLRLGKEKECEELISAVHAEVPYNDATLQAMTICYRELHKPELICDLYAAAAKKDPANEELLTHLFMSYVRIGDYKKQQMTAMTLYKLAPKNPYYFWAVMSIVMQVHTSKPELKCSVVLPLAERMVYKFVQEDKIEAEQEVQLYLMILEMQNKLEEALNVIEGPLNEKLQACVSLPVKKVELLMKLKRWHEANVMLKQLLKEDIDCWSHYKDYLDSVFHIIDNPDDNKNNIEGADRSIAECAGFLSNLQEDNQRLTHRLRGPYLAHLEFYSRLTSRGDKTDIHLGDLVELFMLYFHEFGAKQCCLSDLKPYLKLMSLNQMKDFLDQVFKLVQLNDGETPSTMQQMLRYISNLQLSRYLGFHETLNVESKLKLITCLIQFYESGMQFNEGQLPTDLCHNDPYALLTAHICYDIWIETNDKLYIRDAIVVLENALLYSTSNYQLKLLLLKFYNLIGGSKEGHRTYELLDIKHMQLDTLGYFQLWPLLSTGQYTIACQIFNLTLKFFTASCRESADHLTFSYKYGSFLKISEFVEFRDRLNNSLHYAFVQVEKSLMDIFHSTSYQNTVQIANQVIITPYFKMDWNKLEDNRDFTTVWSANPPDRRITPELIQQSYKTEVDLLRLRMLILQIIICTVNLNNSDKVIRLSNGNKKSNENTAHDNCNNLSDLNNIVDELIQLYDRLVKSPHPKFPRNIIEGPPESRLHDYISSLMVPIIFNLYKIVNGIFNCRKDSSLKNKHNSDDKKMLNGCQNPGNNSDITSSGCKNCNNDNEDYSNEINWKECDVNDYVMASKIVSSCLLQATNVVKKRSKEIANGESLNGRLEIMQDITLTVEIICFTSIICGVIHSMVKDIKTPLVKKGKKKKEPINVNNDLETTGEHKRQLDCVEWLITDCIKAVEGLDSVINYLEDIWVCDSAVNEMSSLNLEEMVGPSLNQRIGNSFTNSLQEIIFVLRRKHRYLDELKL
ncbi:phagocyte signaling impaired [Lycorma delicatula]|uniref:phagocyte signaling impaired n=1 Tax=Lycorma delicatula TaxID=130591 RepID=UPI003F513A3E